MANQFLRNVLTNEVEEIDTLSDEYREKIAEEYDNNGSLKPLWEITGAHKVVRMESGALRSTDHGYEDKPVPFGVDRRIQSEPHPHPERELTPGEREMGIKSNDEKMKDILDGGHEHMQDAPEPAAKLEPAPVEKRRERAEKRAGRSGSSGGAGRSRRKSGATSGASGSAGQTAPTTGQTGGDNS